jgi:Tol biopolymer transport system component
MSTEAAPPKKSRRWLKLIAGLVTLGLLAAVCLLAGLTGLWLWFQPDVTQVKEVMTRLTEPPVFNQIAFVGNDDNIWLTAPDGSGLRQLTSDEGAYRFPTWSPDGRKLAFIGLNDTTRQALFVSPTARSVPTVLYDRLDSAPFYLYWSPDSRTITFLTQETDGLAMRQIEADVIDSDHVLGYGQPFYWAWSPSSKKLLMHVGGARALSEEAHLSLLEDFKGGQRIQLDLSPGKFQAPFWSKDGRYFYYIAADDRRQEAIYKTQADTLEQTLIAKLKGFTYLTLSPDDKYIAFVQVEGRSHPPFGAAYLVDTAGQKQHPLVDNLVGSLYWSPDGRKLAMLTISRREDGSTAKAGGLAAPLPQEIFLRWLIYDVEKETVEPLISFAPTNEFLQTIPYFDQYHLSLTFWSPDSRYFVITREESDKGGTVWVVDTTGQEEPRQVGEGTLAVWSWR